MATNSFIVDQAKWQVERSNEVTEITCAGEHPQRMNAMLDPKYTNEYSFKSGKL